MKRESHLFILSHEAHISEHYEIGLLLPPRLRGRRAWSAALRNLPGGALPTWLKHSAVTQAKSGISGWMRFPFREALSALKAWTSGKQGLPGRQNVLSEKSVLATPRVERTCWANCPAIVSRGEWVQR